MPDYVVRRLTVALNQRQLAVNGQRILLLGLAYKRNTGDARESPSRPHRRAAGRAGRRGAGRRSPRRRPRTCPTASTRVDATPDVVAVGRAAVVLLVDHDDFDLDAIAARRALPARHPPPRQRPRRRAPLISRGGGGCRRASRPGTTRPSCRPAPATAGTNGEQQQVQVGVAGVLEHEHDQRWRPPAVERRRPAVGSSSRSCARPRRRTSSISPLLRRIHAAFVGHAPTVVELCS